MNKANLCLRFATHLRSLSTLRHHHSHLLPKNPPLSPQQPPLSRVSDRSKLFSSSSSSNCWSCGSPVLSRPPLLCESCGVIQRLDRSVDYFQIFGLEKTYDIEEGSLNGKFKDWQKKLHPDLVHSKPEREREYAAEQSARVIDACRTLSNPLPRAIYLMKLQGIVVDEEQTISEPDLLAELMEIREAVEETSDPPTLKKMQSEVLEKMRHWSNHFSSAFQNQDTEEALKSIRRMRYYQRANEAIEKKL